MKREFLESLGLEKESVDKIMAENGADLEREKAKTTQAKADLADAQAKLAEREKYLEGLQKTAGDAEANKKKLEELQAKYEADTNQYKSQLAARDYEDAINRAISDKMLKFSSKAAERDFIASVKEKQLELKDGILNGLDEFIQAQKEADPGAFASSKPLPRFVGPSGNVATRSSVTAAEQAAQVIGRSSAESGKVANNILAMYTGGKT